MIEELKSLTNANDNKQYNTYTYNDKPLYVLDEIDEEGNEIPQVECNDPEFCKNWSRVHIAEGDLDGAIVYEYNGDSKKEFKGHGITNGKYIWRVLSENANVPLPSETPTPTESPSPGSSGLSGGQIAGIVLLSLGILGFIIFIIMFILKSKKKKSVKFNFMSFNDFVKYQN
jgi:hypothetical protein